MHTGFWAALFLAATPVAHATDSTGALDLAIGYVSAPQATEKLAQDIAEDNSGAHVDCTNTVTVKAGAQGTVTAAKCSLNNGPADWFCRNDKLEGTHPNKSDKDDTYKADPMASDGFNLTNLVVTECNGN